LSLNLKSKKVVSIVVLVAALLVAVLSQASVVNAQTDTSAIVIIQPSVGGSTNPAAGTYSYENGLCFPLLGYFR
jgi:hypothetical protein